MACLHDVSPVFKPPQVFWIAMEQQVPNGPPSGLSVRCEQRHRDEKWVQKAALKETEYIKENKDM